MINYIKYRIKNLIRESNGTITFVDLMKLPRFKGNHGVWNKEYNLVYWLEVSDIFGQAVQELARDSIIQLVPTSTLTYLSKGYYLDTSPELCLQNHNPPRWLPVVLTKGSNFDHRLLNLCD